MITLWHTGLDVDLPPDMPPPPKDVASDPGMTTRHFQTSGPRRPAGELFPAEWAAKKFTWGRDSWRDVLTLHGSLFLWLSYPQKEVWYRQSVCEYCGAGRGLPCFSRGPVKFGLPQRTRPADYFHAKRQTAALDTGIQVPPVLFPDWIWWAKHAVGQDEWALKLCLTAVYGSDWTDDYLAWCATGIQCPGSKGFQDQGSDV